MSTWVPICNRGETFRWVMLAVVAGLLALTVPGTASAASSSWVSPNRTNDLDCNGWSSSYHCARSAMKSLCTDPVEDKNGKAAPFVDNGWYVGHDEPSVKFISSQPGSGNRMTYFMRLPIDPFKPPTPSGSVTDYGELSIAPWFGLPICNPLSYPQDPCTPDSDTNVGLNVPNAAGSAFLELQLYPPGFTPFIDNNSCSRNYWCGALTIDSLECTYGFTTCNPNCEDPINFSYLQTNGVPTGPPSPQLTDASTFLPDAHTLYMNGGDVLAITIVDPSQGLTAIINDLTTHRKGWVTASAANGFMDTNIADCSGRPFTFHAEYNTARQQNRVPWAALEGGVLMEQEIGHSEACNSLANQDPYSTTYADGQSYSDPYTYDTCDGGSEGPNATGEGPCNPLTFICQNATTQGPTGPVACPTDNSATGAHCEFSDSFCFPKGDRIVLINGVPTAASNPLDFCSANRYQNGDLDFDGISYQPNTWPDGSPDHPTPASYTGPFTGGRPYPTIQFETDISGSANLCKTATGAGCTVPPISADFYPFWSLTNSRRPAQIPAPRGTCVWDFGNSIPGVTTEDFGRDAQYGAPDLSWYGGTNISVPLPNPQFSGRCRAKGA
jgi:hypothetical protein